MIPIGQYNVPPDLAGLLKDMKVRLAALELGKPRLYAEVLTEQTTGSGSPVDLGGPNVTIQVPSQAFVAVYAQADLKAVGGAGFSGTVSLVDSAGDFAATQILAVSTTGTYITLATAPAGISGWQPPVGGPLTFPASAGKHTYSLWYAGGGATGSFKNRKLWVWTLG